MNLKQKIKNLVEEKKPNDTLLQEVSTKLASASNIDYEAYNTFLDIEYSVYRYNNFLKNNMQNNAEKEAKNLINLSDENSTVLQGGISNIKYIWHTEPNACKKCRELDGTEYNSKEDIPEKPHPNCKCYIEEIKDDDEACDCYKFLIILMTYYKKLKTYKMKYIMKKKIFIELLIIIRTVILI